MKIMILIDHYFVVSRGFVGSSYDLDLIMYYSNNIKDIVVIDSLDWIHVKNNTPTIVYIYCSSDPSSFKDAISFYNQKNVPVVLYSDDAFYIDRMMNMIQTRYCDGLLLSVKMDRVKEDYERIISANKDVLRLKSVESKNHLFVNSSIFKDYKLQKEYDVLIYGNVEGVGLTYNGLNSSDLEYFKGWKERTGEKEIPEKFDFYPLRNRVYVLLKDNKEIRVKVILMSKRGCWQCETRSKFLSIEINKAYMVLATRSRTDKCMRKYMEIASSGSVILGNIPTDYRDLFSGNVIEINDNMKDGDIIMCIKKALQDKKALEEKGKRFGEYFRAKFGIDNEESAKEFLALTEKFLRTFTKF